LGGITPDQEKPGFKHFNLRPGIVNSVDWVKCDYKSPYGKIVSNWKIENGLFEYDVTVPANSTATVFVPYQDVKEGGKDLSGAEGVTFLRFEKGCSVFKVESGSYHFTSN
jgi:alpha-L-rhamnosidase